MDIHELLQRIKEDYEAGLLKFDIVLDSNDRIKSVSLVTVQGDEVKRSPVANQQVKLVGNRQVKPK